MKAIPVILCGGAGTRLWPLSRQRHPKQLMSLVDDCSLLQSTVRRCAAHPGLAPPVLVCDEAHRFLVAEQLRELGIAPGRIILEPEGRNTAPALALAAGVAAGREDAVLVVLPSDHLLRQPEPFLEALTRAIDLAAAGSLVTFGVPPDGPETGYGYIRRGEPFRGAFRVDAFVEKPDRDRAAALLAAGDCYWNSGIFVFRAGVYLEALMRHRPAIASAVAAACNGLSEDLDFTRVDERAFRASPSESIDYAVMEQADNALVVPLDAGWSDVGSWDALWQVSEKDTNNNALFGDLVVRDVGNSYIRAEHRLVSVVGLDDVVVVETADAVMVASRNRAQEVKSIVDNLAAQGREERYSHTRVYRPWGYYEGIHAGPAFQVKRISVKPGASLSLQLHRHRAEHWVVVSGTATVTIGDRTFRLACNASCHIPAETQHRLQNLTEGPLEIIEVQSGSYLGEDDIVRFEDDYGR